MTPNEIFEGSNGDATKALYEKLATLGPVGHVALNLFRACKCSGRAKKYRGSGYKRAAYERKNYSLGQLCFVLAAHAEPLGIEWGWKRDPEAAAHCWVLYVDTPKGQVSFHAEARLCDRDYAGEWDQTTHSPQRIVAWTTELVPDITL